MLHSVTGFLIPGISKEGCRTFRKVGGKKTETLRNFPQYLPNKDQKDTLFVLNLFQ